MARELPPIKCGHCGALVQASRRARVLVCAQCGATISVPESSAGLLPGQAVGAVVAPPPSDVERRRARTRRRALIALVLLLVAGTATGVLAFLQLERERQVAAAEKLHWLTSGGSPVPVVVPEPGDAGLLLGYVRRGPVTNPLSLAAFDSETLTLRWEAPGIDQHGLGELVGADVLDAHNGWAVAAIGVGRLGLYELSSGALAETVELGAAVTAVCAPPDAAPAVFVSLANGETLKVSVPSGARERAQRPGFCVKGEAAPAAGACQPELGLYACVERGSLPKLERHEARYGMELGDALYVIARPREGDVSDPTRDSVLAFERGAKEPRWIETLQGTIVTERLSADLLYVVLRTSSGLRIRGLNLETGFKAFDEALPRSTVGTAKRPLLDRGRLYLPRADWLDVLDAKSGAAIGALGAR